MHRTDLTLARQQVTVCRENQKKPIGNYQTISVIMEAYVLLIWYHGADMYCTSSVRSSLSISLMGFLDFSDIMLEVPQEVVRTPQFLSG
jgi:hypothetical protein